VLLLLLLRFLDGVYTGCECCWACTAAATDAVVVDELVGGFAAVEAEVAVDGEDVEEVGLLLFEE